MSNENWKVRVLVKALEAIIEMSKDEAVRRIAIGALVRISEEP